MPVNVSPEYSKAEKKYLEAESIEEKLEALDEMIRTMPGHKGAENLRAQLRLRKKKLLEQQEKTKLVRRGSSKTGIKKEDMQCVLLGKTNSGKSSLLKVLTKTHQKISELKFTTTEPKVSMMNYNTAQIQLIEIPAFDSEKFDKGIVYTADTAIIVATYLEDITEIINKIKTSGKIIIAFNKSDLLSPQQKRKISETLKSKFKKYPFVLVSSKTHEGLDELKKIIFDSFEICRVYTKEPGINIDSSKQRPMILPPNSTVKDVAEKILKGFSSRIIQTRIWGPSSKFAGQIVGLKHKIKDMDIVEFKTK